MLGAKSMDTHFKYDQIWHFFDVLFGILKNHEPTFAYFYDIVQIFIALKN